MASVLIKEDRIVRNERLKRAEDSRKHLTNTLQNLGNQIDVDLRERITTVHQNAQSLETQSRTLKNRTAALQKTTKQWSTVAEGARSRLKELGDVQNWAEMIEHELLVMEETLNIVYSDDLDEIQAHGAAADQQISSAITAV